MRGVRMGAARSVRRMARPSFQIFRPLVSNAGPRSAPSEGSLQGSHGAKPLPAMSAAVLIERLPVVLPKPPDWALEYRHFSMERSQRHRKLYPPEFLAAAAEPPSDDTKRDLDPGAVDLHTTTDLFSFYSDKSRWTDADAREDARSVQRRLDRRLYLLIKGVGLGPLPSGALSEEVTRDLREERWRLPERLYSNEDSLRQCAESAASSIIPRGTEDVYFVGNAPFAHLEESATQKEGQEPSMKRFFFWVHWIGGEVIIAPAGGKDFAWVTKEEALVRLKGTRESYLLEELLLE